MDFVTQYFFTQDKKYINKILYFFIYKSKLIVSYFLYYKKYLYYKNFLKNNEIIKYKSITKNAFTALLPIKSESQRVPNKNFKPLNNKPLFKWILEKLISINEIDQIIINTDAVKKVINKLGNKINKKIIVKQRIDKLIGNKISMNEIIKDDLRDSINNHNYDSCYKSTFD